MAILIQISNKTTGVKIPIDKPEYRIGRAENNDLCLHDDLVSSEHAVIEVVESLEGRGHFNFYLKDLNSTNATYLNEEKITRSKLKKDDIIRIGLNSFKFFDETEGDLKETTKLHKSWLPGVFYTKEKK